MSKEQLQKSISDMLPDSTISGHQKIMVSTLLYSFNIDQLKSILEALETEKKKLGELNRQEQRITLKYQMAMEKVLGSANDSSQT